VGHSVILGGAEDETDSGVFVRPRPVLARVLDVQVHLPRVGVCEAPELEIDEHEAAQPSMEEHEIHAVPLVAHAQAPLASEKREVVTELEEEGLETMDEALFEVALRVLVLQVEELEHERLAQREASVCVGVVCGRGLGEGGRLVLRPERAFVDLRVDLPTELTTRPPASEALGLVERPRLGLEAQELDVVGPRQREAARRGGARRFCRRRLQDLAGGGARRFCRHCLPNREPRCRGIAIRQEERTHLREVASAEASAEPRGERLCEPLDELRAIASAFRAPLLFLHDLATDLEVGRRHHGVDCLRRRAARTVDEISDPHGKPHGADVEIARALDRRGPALRRRARHTSSRYS